VEEARAPLLTDERARGAGEAGASRSPVRAGSLEGITKRFPGVVANEDVHFEAAAGEVHALLGENGAGKTTLSNVLTGLYRPDEGEIEIFGERMRFEAPRDAIAAGISMVHQHFRLVTPFTVAENIVLGDQRAEGRSFVVHPRAIERRVSELGERYGLEVDPRARIWQLSVGEQQRVEILKALYRDARILIMDEPTAVLTPQEAERLFQTLRAMADEGRTVIFISHKLHEVLAVASRVTVLRGGRNVATVPAAGATPRSLASLMVGREIAEAHRVGKVRPPGDVVVELVDVSVAGDRGGLAVSGVSLEVRAGEIVGVAGVAGNGQRELAEAVTGLRGLVRGVVRVDGRRLDSGDPRAAIAAGVAYVPEDRLGTGLAPSLSIAQNVALKRYRGAPVSRGPIIFLRRMRELALSLIKRYDVKAPGPDTPARNLSGGNLQKLVLGREFEGEPHVLIAAQPTRGLDVGAIESVHGYLRDASSRGVAVLMVSEDLDELMALSDRIVVMYEGEIAGEVDPETVSVAEIGLLMAGGGR
jgi:general nucleoside transport system ATP-binding protein